MKILVMSHDGETQLEKPEFKTQAEAWNYADSLGSKWFFYPFYFVVSNSGKTIIDAPQPLNTFHGKRTETVAKLFRTANALIGDKKIEPDEFAFYIAEQGAKKPAPTLERYKIEWTDTFGGEANYNWVNRSIIEATDIKQAITKAKQERYYSPLPRHVYGYSDNDSTRIDIVGQNVCCFIDWTDEEPDQEPNT